MSAHREVSNITKSYLNLQRPKENRGNIIAFFLIFLDFFGIFPLLGDPFSFRFFMAAIIPVVLIHIWAILYIVDPFKYELSYYFFFGVYGIVNTYVLFIAIQKLLYMHLGVEGMLPFVIGLLLLLGILAAVNWLNIKALYSGTYFKLQNKSGGNMGWIVGASGIGYVVGQILLTSFFSDSAQLSVMVILLSLLSVATAYCSTFIHRYFFILKNMDAVKKVYPEFGLPKQMRHPENVK